LEKVKYSISSKVEEKLGEKYSSLAKAAPTIVTDIVTNIAIYGGSKLISTDLFSVKELISFSVLDVAKIAIANFIDTTPIYQEEPASNILARPKPLFNQTTSDDLVIDQEEPAISDVLPFVDQTTSVFAV
jgi:hypothetical protein